VLDVVLAHTILYVSGFVAAADDQTSFFAARVKHWPASIRALDG